MELNSRSGSSRGFLHFGASDSYYADERRAQAAMNSITILRQRNPLRDNKPRLCADDAFCRCYGQVPCLTVSCTCGEPGKVLEWVWDDSVKDTHTLLINENKDVKFHLHFSIGTAVIRGSLPITDNQHYWEVKMTSLVYGTDMMVGVGTHDADIQKFSNSFCSVLGINDKTWGLSYKGNFHHEGQARSYTSGFGQGSIIGVHLDMWRGTLSFYKNRQPLGIACTGLKGKTLYPMVSSTAARSGMRIIHSVSFPSSLQYLCCVALRKAVPVDRSVFEVVPMPRPLHVFLAKNLGWLLGEDHLESYYDNKVSSSNELSEKRISEHDYDAMENNCAPMMHSDDDAVASSSSSGSRERVMHVQVPSSKDFIYLGRGVLVQNCRPSTSRQNTDSDVDEGLGNTSKKLKVTEGYFGFFQGPQ